MFGCKRQILVFAFIFLAYWNLNIAASNLSERMKRHVMIVALTTNHNKSKMANFLKVTRWQMTLNVPHTGTHRGTHQVYVVCDLGVPKQWGANPATSLLSGEHQGKYHRLNQGPNQLLGRYMDVRSPVGSFPHGLRDRWLSERKLLRFWHTIINMSTLRFPYLNYYI